MRKKMNTRMLYAVAIAAAAAALTAGSAGAITPVSGGDAGGTTVTINNGPGDQTDPHVSGDLAAYTSVDTSLNSTIRYYGFVTGLDSVVPVGAPGDNDFLSGVDSNRIVFSRSRAADGVVAVMLYDTVSGVLTELDPQPSGSDRFGAVIGGDTVAFSDIAVGGGDIFAYDLATGTPTNLTQSFEADGNPAVSPAGNAVVWERCVGSNCGIYRSVNTGSGWGSPELVSDTLSNEGNPDTDGTTVVYDSDRPSANGEDIYFQPLMGGSETELQLAGDQRNPSISSGVIAFESHPGTSWDLYVYIISSDTLLQVTNTPGTDEVLNDVTVLGNGDIRVVWAAAPVGLTDHDIQARTFSVPATHVFTAAVQQPINSDGSSVFKAGKGVLPVKFSLAVDGNPTCTLPAATIALTRLSGAVTGPVNESDFVMPADSDSSFRIDSCQYIYNLSLKSLSAGTYRVEIKIDGQTVGSATFELR